MQARDPQARRGGPQARPPQAPGLAFPRTILLCFFVLIYCAPSYQSTVLPRTNLLCSLVQIRCSLTLLLRSLVQISSHAFPAAVRCAVRTWRVVLSAYARATRCPVLTSCMMLPACYAVSGTDVVYGATRNTLRGQARPVRLRLVRLNPKYGEAPTDFALHGSHKGDKDASGKGKNKVRDQRRKQCSSVPFVPGMRLLLVDIAVLADPVSSCCDIAGSS
eukprot:2470780-Rhodomonas_salina.1